MATQDQSNNERFGIPSGILYTNYMSKYFDQVPKAQGIMGLSDPIQNLYGCLFDDIHTENYKLRDETSTYEKQIIFKLPNPRKLKYNRHQQRNYFKNIY